MKELPKRKDFPTGKEYRAAYSKAWAEKFPEKVREAKRKTRIKHREANAARRRAFRAANRAKVDAWKRAWEAANPELVSMQRVRRRIKAMNASINGGLRLNYGITLERFNEMNEAQGGVCAICLQNRPTSRIKRLVVDHDHKTGGIRGLLCHRCNCGLGYFADDVNLIRRAIDYLERYIREHSANSTGRIGADYVRDVLAAVPKEGGEEGREVRVGPYFSGALPENHNGSSGVAARVDVA